MQPKLGILTPKLIPQIIDEAFQLLMNPGVKVLLPEARNLLADAGAIVDKAQEVVFIPEDLAREALKTVPLSFYLYDKKGNPTIRYGGDAVHFDPGSSGVNVLDYGSLQHRPATTQDLIDVIKIADQLSQYDAQSTALVCSEVPKEIGDLYRLYLVLLFSDKPVVTGSFSSQTTGTMIDMLAIFSGGHQALAKMPTAVFDVCPSPPLIWSQFGAQNLLDLARTGVPAEIVSMPLAGAAAPITLLGSVVQHAAECISGMTIHQLAKPGSPIIWGGAPAIMDMREGTTPMGAIETAMIDAAYAQVGKNFGFPTHAYMGASDAKIVDAQAGMESSTTAMIGALAGINMISGAGMLDFLACMSLEKLVIDAEAIGMAKRMLDGLQVRTDPLAANMYEEIDFKGNFLKQPLTRRLIKEEQYLPSAVIDRGSIRRWQQNGSPDIVARAHSQVQGLLDAYQPPDLAADQVAELKSLVKAAARKVGMEALPEFEHY
jgi:trimethylamine--corrinoid protein Co-methyltransferase